MEQKINSLYQRGLKLIYPQRKELWQACVESQSNGARGAEVLERAVELMETISQNQNIDLASQQFQKGAYSREVLNIILYFSKNGVEFFRKNVDVISGHTMARNLKNIELENNEFERQLAYYEQIER